MKRTEELFSLIHSLDKHEKRFFKLSASIEAGEKQYMRMFDIIVSQSVYNEEEILRTLRISKNVLAFQKNYLQRLILNHITFLHCTRKNNTQFLFTQAELLRNKGLYSQLTKLLRKIKEQARGSDTHTTQLDIAGMEHGLAWKDQRLDDAITAIEEKKKILSVIKRETEYHSLANEIIIKLVRLGDASKTEIIKQLKSLVNDPLIRNEKNAISFRCRNYLFHAMSLYHSVTGSQAKQYLYAKKNFDLFSSPERTKNFTMNQVFAIHNLVAGCNAVKKYDEAKQYLDVLLTSSASLVSQREKIWVFFTFYDNSFDYYINTGQFKEGALFTEQHEEKIHKLAAKLDVMQLVMLYFLIARIYFGNGNFTKCIEWMNRIRHEEERSVRIRPDLEASTKLFFLIAHYEKGNSDLVPYLSKSLHRHLRGEKRLFKTESLLLDFFGKRIGKAESQKERIKELRKLKAELLPLLDVPYESALLKQFDYIAWIDSKIENRPFAEVVQDKAKLIKG